MGESVDERFPRWLRVKEAALAADLSTPTIYRREQKEAV